MKKKGTTNDISHFLDLINVKDDHNFYVGVSKPWLFVAIQLYWNFKLHFFFSKFCALKSGVRLIYGCGLYTDVYGTLNFSMVHFVSCVFSLEPSLGEIWIISTNCTKLHSHCSRLPCHVLPKMPAGNVRRITFHWLWWIIFCKIRQENRSQLINRSATAFNSKSKDTAKFSNLCSRQ